MHSLTVTLRIAFVVLSIVARAGLAAAQDTPETLPGASNYTRVDATVACAGATELAAFAELKRRGFVAVVNFRMPEEPGVAEEAQIVEQADLQYFHLPFVAGQPNAEVADRFLKIVADPAHQPVYIHCGSANRVAGMWLIKRMVLDGWTEERAVAEAEAIGLRTPALKQFALEYVQARKRYPLHVSPRPPHPPDPRHAAGTDSFVLSAT